MPAKKTTTPKPTEANSIIARSEDGTIQITFTIPWSDIERSRNEAIDALGKDIEIPGFRKGKAPKDKLLEKIPQNTLVEKTLVGILPKLFSDAVTKHNITPAIYPKFEVLKASENENWQVRAVTTEIPNINFGDYKKVVTGKGKAKKIWTPSSAASKDSKSALEEEKEPSRQEKEQEVIKLLIANIKVDIPKILIEEEVNSRLSRLLQRIEKLGLTLESYLASVGKNAKQLRQEYEDQSINALRLDLILTGIAKKE
ncbi:hypothetical protein IID22_03635, partial [Patescibacteria group bacterium]|nr:hypothetical protein [Patescibacteria group bacterium]